MRKALSIVLAAGFVVAAVAVAAAAQRGPGADPAGKPETHRREYLFLHADGLVMRRDGTIVEVRLQKGIIQEVDEDSVTVKSADGFVQTYVIDESTRVREEGQEASVDDLEAGEMAKVAAVKDGDGYTAKVINCVGRPGPRLERLVDAA